MKLKSQNMWSVSLVAGLVMGIWMGVNVWPTFVPLKPQTTVEETAAQAATREELQLGLAKTLTMSESIVAATVHITGQKASATVTFDGSGARAGQVETIASQIASGVEGLHPGFVAIYDSEGKHLNLRALQEHEQKAFWTSLALNVAKILGILAALVTMRFILMAAYRRFGDGGSAPAT